MENSEIVPSIFIFYFFILIAMFYVIHMDVATNKEERKEKEKMNSIRVITDISDKYLFNFYLNMSEEDKETFYRIARGHRCHHAYCCDHEDLIEHDEDTNRELSEFLEKKDFNFKYLQFPHVYFEFSHDSSRSRNIHKYEKSRGSRRNLQ